MEGCHAPNSACHLRASSRVRRHLCRRPAEGRSPPPARGAVARVLAGREAARRRSREEGKVGPHPAPVRSCVHIPGTGLLATGSDGTIRLWDLKLGKVAKELKDGHPAEVTSVVASPDGKWLISTGPDGTRGWDVAAG